MSASKIQATARSRREFLKAASAGVMGIGMPSLVLAQSPKELVVGGAAGHKVFLDAVIPQFEKQYQCKVIFEGTRSLVNLEKMVNNKAKPYLSVVLMDDPVMIAAIKEDVIEKMAASKVPNLTALKPGAVHQDGFWANYLQPTTSVAVNTTKLKALPSYELLWAPEFKGKVIIPSLQNTEGLAMLMIAAMLETGKPISEAQYQPDAGFRKLKALKPNLLTIYTQIPQALNLLEQGEASVIAGMVSINTYERKTKGAPIDLILPKEGAMAMPSGIAKVKNGPDPELSYAFINEMLGKFQSEIAGLSLAMPTNASVAPPAGLPKGEVFAIDWAYVNDNRKGWVERWDKEMSL